MAFCLLSAGFEGKKPAGKKRIKIQPELLLERHAPPFPPAFRLACCHRPAAGTQNCRAPCTFTLQNDNMPALTTR
ncbi:hypothetical protein [Janthinobacterium sp. UMAB-56]|uniref:hypothetical protein n=1 Tax=Janthinobacterium sp. UMAB-56 TaxID=1365361 RepID=UPI001C598558|nr:hypothetical protein [Janthinobacterium sp. UMAB-56]